MTMGKVLLAAGAAAVLALGLYAVLIEPQRLVITRWTVETEKWGDQKPLTIALISDLHAIWPWMTPGHLEKIVSTANAQKPDLILLLGDYVGTHPYGRQLQPENGVAPLKKLSASCGVFAVYGNHDIRYGHGWPEALAATGISVLQNEARPIDCNDRKFWGAGLAELWWQKQDIARTLAQVSDSNPVIMMMHNPDAFPDIPASVSLSAAGHTHGGQVRFPFIGAIPSVVPSKYGLRYLHGHIIEDGKDLVVTSGIGASGLPVRFLTPPEIALVTLQGGGGP